ncbi:hypothetical protein FHS96_005021 [Sphingomonas zeicaulis]|uniref:hypothetical protein n=1 Tax=Sphingomonas zeicaulis TaxID=1632740 RepID=UPI003D1C99B2
MFILGPPQVHGFSARIGARRGTGQSRSPAFVVAGTASSISPLTAPLSSDVLQRSTVADAQQDLKNDRFVTFVTCDAAVQRYLATAT